MSNKPTVTKNYTAEDTILTAIIEGEQFTVHGKTVDTSDRELAQELSETVGIYSTEDILAMINR